VVHFSSPYWANCFDLVDAGEQPEDVPSIYMDDNLNIVMRDDTQYAQNYANQLRSAHENSPMPMSYTIPQFTLAYEVGDAVSAVVGRNVSLATNLGIAQGEGPYYPRVVAITWDFSGDQQSTNLQLSDRRIEPQPPGRVRAGSSGWWRQAQGQ
jgi:hypothetical protein